MDTLSIVLLAAIFTLTYGLIAGCKRLVGGKQ